MASMNLAPHPRSAGRIFFHSQLLAKPRQPPKDVTFNGQTAIVTGSNVGIGLETCRQMFKRGLSRLIMGVRNVQKGEDAAISLRKSHPKASIVVWELNMCSYESIQTFAQRCNSLDHLDLVILNAGVLKPSFTLAPTGHEEGLQVNYLSTTLLAALLLPVLQTKRSTEKPARLTIVGSSVSLYNELKFRDADPIIAAFDDSKNFGPAMDSYANTKMCALITADRLSKSIEAKDVIINIVDPGLVGASGLHRNFSGFSSAVFSTSKSLFARSIEQGSWTYLDAVAVKGCETHGGFIVDGELHPMHPMLYTAEGKKLADRLWRETLEELRQAGVDSALSALKP